MRLTSLARPWVVVGDDADLSQARAALAHAEHVVVTTADGNPLGVLGPDELRDLGDSPASLAALAHRFPPLLVMPAEPDELDVDELLDLAELVSRAGIRHVLLEHEDRPAGVIPRAAIAAALPLDQLEGRNVRAGNPDVPALMYVCRKCTPPSRQALRAPTPDGRPPNCRRIFHHGAMEPDA